MPTTHAIVGREPELQQLREVVESAARPVVAFVEGDAGVGKTALLETARRCGSGELFVSERTVEANLTRAYRKLGVRSRTELARRLPAD